MGHDEVLRGPARLISAMASSVEKKTKGKEKLGNLSIHIVPHPLPPKNGWK